ncbi:substrate-binding domain-containing protein [Coraliomargarita sp. W4R72]
MVLRNRPDGAIVFHTPGDGLLQHLHREQVPTVILNYSSDLHIDYGANLSGVYFDNVEIGRRAADYFTRAGHRVFAVVGDCSQTYGDERCQGYCERLASDEQALAYAFTEYSVDACTFDLSVYARLQTWLLTLPPQTALFAVNDRWAHLVRTACRESGIQVPKQIAILGVDNDEAICMLERPELSSVPINKFEKGRQAAILLKQMLKFPGSAHTPVRIGTSMPITRASTDLCASRDITIRKALDYMRSAEGVAGNVAALSQQVGLSRQSLHRKFRRELNSSVEAIYVRIRMDKACQLLIETSLTIDETANQCGFEDASWFSKLFKREIGCPPGAYRLAHANV